MPPAHPAPRTGARIKAHLNRASCWCQTQSSTEEQAALQTRVCVQEPRPQIGKGAVSNTPPSNHCRVSEHC